VIIALVDTGTRPLLEGGAGLSHVLVRLAHSFACDAAVYICAWHQIVIENRGVSIVGNLLTLDGDELVRAAAPERVDALYFYPTAGCAVQAVNDAEYAALERIRARSISLAGLDRNEVVAHLLLEAARRGVVTNAPGPLGRWGRKDQLEYGMRWYERVSGRRITRPETHPVAAVQAPLVLASFIARGLDAIVKPANAARGERLRLISSSDKLDGFEEDEPVVVQELVRSPLLADGFKTDLRVYLLIDGTSRERSRRLPPILVRRAAAPYARLDERAEITNTSYRRRLGLPPDIQPLDEVSFPESIRMELRTQLHSLTEILLDALFRWKGQHDWRGNCDAARAMIWGLDVIASIEPGPLTLFLLEINVYPQLFRGDAVCDALVEDCLANAYLPAVGRLISSKRNATAGANAG
jgi:hypothetical protein